jgi:hypothetical protein
MLLCKKCDVFVGFDGANVAKIPDDVPREKLNDICWICRRTRAEVFADPYGRDQPEPPTGSRARRRADCFPTTR